MANMTPLDRFDYRGKTVLLRVDINSPIDPTTKRIVNENRIQKSIPTMRHLLAGGAKIALIAHQGDTLDYQNLIPMAEHAEKLSGHLGRRVAYIDDVCGPAARESVKALRSGEAVLLGNLRYLSEEISTFENAVKLRPEEMLETYLVRGLAPIVDYYVNDAFAAAHRSAPSMVAFQELKPTAAGVLLFDEVAALDRVMHAPDHPSVFVLGGAKISDAFGMMEQVLASGTADQILTCGITGEIMLLAAGHRLGRTKEQFLKDRSLDVFVEQAAAYLKDYGDRIRVPSDLAYAVDGTRHEISVTDLPAEQMFMDIGRRTIADYEAAIGAAKTLFVNGPPGVYENPLFEDGTRTIWKAIAAAPGYSVIGGGDTVTAAAKYVDLKDINYVCTAGGAMVRYLSGKRLPLIEAMEKACERDRQVTA
jgi:phosphoglycerate kinase